MDTQRLHSLDGFRGLAALAVAAFHFSSSSTINQVGFFQSGWLSVDLFFVISGVVLDRRYFANSNTNFSEFFAARVGRMMPMYFLMFGVFLILEIMSTILSDKSVTTLIWPLVVNLFALQSFGLLDKLWFYGPSWSISAEIWINLLLFPIMLLRRAIWILIGTVAVCSVLFVTTIDIQSSHDFGWLRCLLGISFGILVSRLSTYRTILVIKPTVTAIINQPTFQLLLSACWVFLLYFTYNLTALHAFAPLLFGILLLFLLCNYVPPIEWLLSRPTLTYLGRISFAIYMTHYFIGGRLMRVLVPYLDRRLGFEWVQYTEEKKWNGLVLGTTELQGFVFLAAYLFLVILVAHFALNMVEAPLYSKSKARLRALLATRTKF